MSDDAAPVSRQRVLIYGMDPIAKKLGISLRKLQLLMLKPAGERPPLRRNHRGVYADEAMLEMWTEAHDMDYGVARELGPQGRARAMRGTRTSDAPPAA